MPIPSERPTWWRVSVGALVLVVEVYNLVSSAPNLLKGDNVSERQGMFIAAVIIIFLGCWLVLTGLKPLWNKPDN